MKKKFKRKIVSTGSDLLAKFIWISIILGLIAWLIKVALFALLAWWAFCLFLWLTSKLLGYGKNAEVLLITVQPEDASARRHVPD